MNCLRTLQIDLAAFVAEPSAEGWAGFLSHYPTCMDCSAAVQPWFELHDRLLALAPSDNPAHPTKHHLLAFEENQESLGVDQRAAVEAHLTSCRACRDELSALRGFDFAALARAAPELAAPVAQRRDHSGESSRFPLSWLLPRLAPALAFALVLAAILPILYQQARIQPPHRSQVRLALNDGQHETLAHPAKGPPPDAPIPPSELEPVAELLPDASAVAIPNNPPRENVQGGDSAKESLKGEGHREPGAAGTSAQRAPVRVAKVRPPMDTKLERSPPASSPPDGPRGNIPLGKAGERPIELAARGLQPEGSQKLEVASVDTGGDGRHGATAPPVKERIEQAPPPSRRARETRQPPTTTDAHETDATQEKRGLFAWLPGRSNQGPRVFGLRKRPANAARDEPPPLVESGDNAGRATDLREAGAPQRISLAADHEVTVAPPVARAGLLIEVPVPGASAGPVELVHPNGTRSSLTVRPHVTSNDYLTVQIPRGTISDTGIYRIDLRDRFPETAPSTSPRKDTRVFSFTVR